MSRGKSVPTQVRCALVWFEDGSRAPIGPSDFDVRDFVVSQTRATSLSLVKVKQQAPPPLPVDTVTALEGLVALAHTLPLRISAGIVCV